MKRFFKRFFKILLVIMVAGVLIVIAIVSFHPTFGGSADKTDLNTYKDSKQFNGKTFESPVPMREIDIFSVKSFETISKFLKGNPAATPDWDIPIKTLSPKLIGSGADSLAYITWMGHSAILLEMQGKIILLDPMFGPVPAPFEFLGDKRFYDKLPIEIEQLPAIDIVIFSHDHYDHLDYESTLALKDKVGTWLVPLGLESHLVRWGVQSSKIFSLDWHEKKRVSGIEFICTPAKHFSGRGLLDKNKTLWASWVINGRYQRLFFSGDGGYWKGFKEIGQRYGPFDFAMVECGQYNKNWPDVHMFPEESLQAVIDLRADIGMPIHWGAFRLAMHRWSEPVEQFIIASGIKNQKIMTPFIGERFNISKIKGDYVKKGQWWLKKE